jgi:hypothetical protein
MNKVGFLPRRDVAGGGRLGLQQRRSPPKAVKLLLPVWGFSYIRQFLEFGLPTLLAPGNVPALAAALSTEFIILTSADDEAFIREHAAFKRLAATCVTKIQPIDHLITGDNYSTTITLAYTEAVRAVGTAMIDTCFFFLVSDYIVADGSLANVLERMQRGASGIVGGNFQVAGEDALPWLQGELAIAKHVLALAPRELMRWALNHLHPATLANMVNVPFSHNSRTNRLFWRVNGGTVLGRFYVMHMVCVRPEVADFVIGASCDYSFIPEMCPSGNVEAVTDSDEYLVIEMQPRDHESAVLRVGPITPRRLAKSLNEWTTKDHRENARHTVVFHAGELRPDLARNIEQADAFVFEVARHFARKPQPYRGHPYWLGTMPAFQDAAGRKPNEDERRHALGRAARRDWPTQRLLWRAKYALMGLPPRVSPSHPAWPDYRAVFREIDSFITDPAQRLLMLSNEPTAFTVALADGGDRVHRLRCALFLRNPSERYEAIRGKFDLCLLELREGEMAQGGELIDRIVPLMKNGGRVVVFVMNRRQFDNAREFGAAVTYHLARFIRRGAVPTEIQFVPANRLRWLVGRGMSNIRALVSRGPLLGVPAAVVGGGLLLCLSLIGNLEALRQSRRKAARGIASSLVMRLSVDAPEPDKVSAHSRLETTRRMKARSQTLARLGDRSFTAPEQLREPQYNRCLELKMTFGLATLGLMTNQVWYDDPRRLAFLLARYKFVAKMLRGRRNAGEVGCGDAFGTRVVLQEVPDVTVYDFDPVFIEDIRARRDERWPLKAEVHDIVAGPLPRKHEALFSLDVLEHIAVTDELAYLANLRGSLAENGVIIIGTPSAESQVYASPLSKAGHINCKSGGQLKVMLDNYFAQVFLFSMNDEVVHTGSYPMANYLFAICTGAK